MSIPGCNWRNANHDESAFRIYEAGAFGGCVVLSTLGPAVPRQIRSRYPNALITARLYMGGPDLPPVYEAAWEWLPYIKDTWDVVDLYQVSNEPDILHPNVSPEAYCEWWIQAVDALREQTHDFPRCPLFGFPMPSIQGTSSWEYAKWCHYGILAADWIAERGYWQEPWQMESMYWGKRYELSRAIWGGARPIHLTEYGCSDASLSREERARQYREYQRGLPGYIHSAHVFCMAGGTSEWDTLGFGVDTDLARDMRVEEDNMPEYQVGEGILNAMAVRGEAPVEDEHYVGDRESYCASEQALYLYSKAANRVTRLPFLA